MPPQQLRAAIDRHASGRGLPTRVPRQFLARQDESRQHVQATYRPVLCFVAAGIKTVLAGDHRVRVGAGEMFIGLLRTPALVSFQAPYLSVMMDVAPAALATVMAQVVPPPEQRLGRGAFFTAAMEPALLSALSRWIELLDEPEHISALAPYLEQEILYRVLLSPLGPALRAATSGGPIDTFRAATEAILNHPHLPVDIQQLAEAAHVSVPTFYRRFRELTGVSPVRFRRLARLQKAREFLYLGGRTATSAAGLVGYASVQQFSRDYRAQYGTSPAQDASRARPLP